MRADSRSVRRRLGRQLLPAEDRPGDNVVRVDATTLKFKQTWPVPGGRTSTEDSPTAAAHSGSPAEAIGNREHDHAGRSANRCPADDPSRPSRGRTCVVRGVRRSLDHELRRRKPDAAARSNRSRRDLDSVAVNPDSPVVDGNVVWVGDWSKPQVVRLDAVGAARPHSISLPCTTPVPQDLLRLDGRGGRRCHLGDNARGPRALAHRSEHERRDAYPPPVPADRGDRGRKRRLGTVRGCTQLVGNGSTIRFRIGLLRMGYVRHRMHYVGVFEGGDDRRMHRKPRWPIPESTA